MATRLTLRTRKVSKNALLKRKQMVVDVLHPNSGTVSKSLVQRLLAKKYKVDNTETIYVFGFKSAIGGGRTTGFACIYDTIEDAYDTEPAYRLRRAGQLPDKPPATSKSRKEAKNKKKLVRGTHGKRVRKADDE